MECKELKPPGLSEVVHFHLGDRGVALELLERHKSKKMMKLKKLVP